MSLIPDPDKANQKHVVKADASSQFVDRFDLIEKSAKTLVMFVALLYGLGLMISNQYLLSIGVSDFSSLRPRFIVTGTWTLLVLVAQSLPLLYVAISVMTVPEKTRKRKWKYRFLLAFAAVSGAASGVIVEQLLIELLTNDSFSISAWKILGYMSVNCFLIGLCIDLWVLPESRTTKRFAAVKLSVLVPCVAFILTRYVERNLYSHVPEAMGGGKPVNAKLIFNHEGATFWKQTGAFIPPEEEPMSSGLIQILYQNEHQAVVKVPYKDGSETKEKIIILNTSLVDGMLPQQN